MKRTTVNEVADFEDVDVPFIGEIYNSKGDFWTAVVKVDGNDTRFKWHTGAAVSIVSDRELWLKDQQLSNTQPILRGPGGTILSVIGTFNAMLEYKGPKITEPVFDLKDQLYSILGKKACVDVGSIACIGEVVTQAANLKEEFPHLFTDLGKLKTE